MGVLHGVKRADWAVAVDDSRCPLCIRLLLAHASAQDIDNGSPASLTVGGKGSILNGWLVPGTDKQPPRGPMLACLPACLLACPPASLSTQTLVGGLLACLLTCG